MREIDPFAFFYNHASAIRGLGGESRSPDPRYCFHTHYVDVRPGLAWFELQLSGVHASRGELALRVHAFRPETEENASLAAAGRLNVWIDEPRDVTFKVRFSALRNVKYAFYGHFLEDGDIHAKNVSVTLVEPEGEEEFYLEPPRSALAPHAGKHDVRPANALIHNGPVQLQVPVSQDCSLSQLAEIGLSGQGGGDAGHWSESFCLAALTAYGVGGAGLEGQIVGAATPGFLKKMADAQLILRTMNEEPRAADAGMFADFLLWPAGPSPQPDPLARWKQVKTWLLRLKIGGLAVIHLRYHHETGPLHAGNAVDGEKLTRNEIGKWALRLIGEGYSVAPIAFLHPSEMYFGRDGLACFNLIVRRI